MDHHDRISVSDKGNIHHEVIQVPSNDSLSADEKNIGDQYGAEGSDTPMTLHRFMPLVAMAFLWTGSQIPLYLYGAVPPYIYGELGGLDRWTWFVLGNLLALASICPFVGSLSDLFGRRWVAVIGACLLIIGNIVSGTARTMNTFIAGMAISGIGAGINELTALAVTSEIAPTRKRGLYNSMMVLTILPFCPSVLWGQLIASTSSWRYIGLFCGLWAAVGLVLTLIFYHPPPRVNAEGLTKKQILGRIDYVGGLLSISGMLLFMAGLQWGGYQYKWVSVHVLVPLILGVVLLMAFFVWESRFAKFPMFPGRIKQEPRILGLTLVITAISGANFFSVILFWPTESYNVYGHNPLAIGIRNITLGFSILSGACINLALLTYLKGHIRALMVASCVLMTAGGGAMACLNLHNLWLVYIVLTIAGLGIGGIVVPASIVTTIICPDDIIATVTALTLAIRVIGGALGYSVYYNVFANKFVYAAKELYLIPVAYAKFNITSPAELTELVGLTASGLLPVIKTLPGVAGAKDPQLAYDTLVYAGQETFAYAYPYVYYVSLAFGCISIICAAFIGDISKYMTDHIAAAI